MNNIRSGEWSNTEIQDLINALFGAICGDYPGAVTIRHSYSTFQQLSQVDREEEARNLTNSNDAVQQVAATSTVQPVTVISAIPPVAVPSTIQQTTTGSADTGSGVPKKRTLKRLFESTLRVTGLSRQRDRNEPESPIPTAERGKDKGKNKGRPSEEASGGPQAAFTQKPKVAIPSASTDTIENRFMGSPQRAAMSSPVLSNFTTPTIVSNSPTKRKASHLFKEPINPIPSTRLLPLISPSSPTFSQRTQEPARGVSPSSRQNQSPIRRIARLPSISTSSLPSSSVQHTVSPNIYNRNTSTTSLNASSPYRENIRTASSLLIKHLSRPPPSLRPHEWHGVEVRLQALARLERIWGRKGAGGSSSTELGTITGLGGGEERERRLFCETVRDGYVLCA